MFMIVFSYTYKYSNIDVQFEDEDNAMILLMALLITMGLAGGTTLPSLTVLIAAWVPERERSKLGGFVLGGSQVRQLGNNQNFDYNL